MPICNYRTSKGRTCKADKLEQDPDQFFMVSRNHYNDYRRRTTTCLTCREFYKKKSRGVKVLPLIPVRDLAPGVRFWMIRMLDRKNGNKTI